MLNDLRRLRAQYVAEARARVDKANPTAEDNAAYDVAMAESDKIAAQIARLERSAATEVELAAAAVSSGRPVATPGRPAGAPISLDEAQALVAREKRFMTALLRGTVGSLSEDERVVLAGRMGQIEAAGSTGTNTAGGYTIAPAFMRELLIAMKAQGGMRAVAREIQTDTGVALPWPTMDDRAQVATIVGENTTITADTDLAFGSQTLNGYTYKSGLLPISLQLLQDSAFDFDSLIRDAIASRFVRGQNAHFTTGTGTGQPQGVLTGAAVGVTGATGSTVTATFDNLIDLMHSVDPVYRPGATYMCHDTTLQILRKIKDAYGRYLWQPFENDMAGSAPGGFLLGYPLAINQDMPVMAANAKSILFGNFQNYIVRDVLAMQMMVLRERFADNLQVAYLAFMRTDGRLISAATPIKWYANSAT